MGAKLNGVAIPLWAAIDVKSGSVLALGAASREGIRTYLAVQGSFDTQPYLGSRSTFVLGGFGGHAGRSLRAGDVLHIGQQDLTLEIAATLPSDFVPVLTHNWTIGVIFGPHTAPDFFTEEDIEMLFSTQWKVHYQSDRTGVRLVGPKPKWARPDGGEAGLHPSNIHDNAYAIGTIDFTGDMPILLGPDGPSLGGFVCPATIVQAELWKLGQLKAGDLVQFRRIDLSLAEAMESAQDKFFQNFGVPLPVLSEEPILEPAILKRVTERAQSMTFRADGDKYLLVEYGELQLDLNLRFRVHILEQNLREIGRASCRERV